jgi:hypothetical protein
MVRVVSSVGIATAVAAAGSAVLAAAAARPGFYFAFGLTLAGLATMQALFPGTGIAPRARSALRTVSGSYVRVTGIGGDPIPSGGGALYASTAVPRSVERAGQPTLRRRVATLSIEGLHVLDLTDRRVRASLGLRDGEVDPGSPVIIGKALSLGADGLLVPSSGGELLVVFPQARAPLAVQHEQVVTLTLPAAVADPLVRRRLAEDEDLLFGFAEALEGGGFDEWLETIPSGERGRFETAGIALGAQAAAYSHFR